MRTLHLFFLLGFTFLFFTGKDLFGNQETAKSDFISIENHLRNNFISLKITGTGGHQNECLNFKINSLKKDTLFILIEPGRRIVSYDSSLQDILILKKYELVLPPFASIILNGYGFCCQSSNHSPSKDALFNIGYMEQKTWVELAEFISHNNFPANAIQNAVWVLSNNHPLSSIHHEKEEEILGLKEKVASLTKQELPWYSLTFKNDTSRLFSNIPEKIWGKIPYYVRNQCIITINIRNSEGTVVATLIENIARGPGEYFVQIGLSVVNWPKGSYSVYIIEDYSNVNKKKDFKL